MTPVQEFIRHVAGVAVFAVAVIGLIAASGCATAPPAAPPVQLEFPAPDTGPGRPDLTRKDRELVDKGWQALMSGDHRAADATATMVDARMAADEGFSRSAPSIWSTLGAHCSGGAMRLPSSYVTV